MTHDVASDDGITQGIRTRWGRRPVGSGKTALIEALTRRMAASCSIGVVTNDIYTKEDAEFLTKNSVLPPDRIVGVETGGCPHTAIREDASMNLEAVDAMVAAHPDIQIMFVESGGDNLSATFSPELADATIIVIDVSEGDKPPRRGGSGVMRSDLLVTSKIDLAPYVIRGRVARGHGARLQAHARRTPLRVHRHSRRPGRGRRGGVD